MVAQGEMGRLAQLPLPKVGLKTGDGVTIELITGLVALEVALGLKFVLPYGMLTFNFLEGWATE